MAVECGRMWLPRTMRTAQRHSILETVRSRQMVFYSGELLAMVCDGRFCVRLIVFWVGPKNFRAW